MPKQQKNQTTSDVAIALDSHEQICAIRYENIEKRLEDGSKRFDRLELMLWGVYPFIVGALVVSRYLS